MHLFGISIMAIMLIGVCSSFRKQKLKQYQRSRKGLMVDKPGCSFNPDSNHHQVLIFNNKFLLLFFAYGCTSEFIANFLVYKLNC